MAAVDRAGCDGAQIPHRPPDGAFMQAGRAYAWAPVVQNIGGNPLATEQALVESSSSIDVPITQRPPLFRLQAQHVCNLLGRVVPLQPGTRQAGNLGQ
jgi:hypothetical protein